MEPGLGGQVGLEDAAAIAPVKDEIDRPRGLAPPQGNQRFPEGRRDDAACRAAAFADALGVARVRSSDSWNLHPGLACALDEVPMEPAQSGLVEKLRDRPLKEGRAAATGHLKRSLAPLRHCGAKRVDGADRMIGDQGGVARDRVL